MKDEVIHAMHSLKIGKTPGIENIPAELLKYGGPELERVMTEICEKIWSTKSWPEEWSKSIIIPIPKKGNQKLCKNYRQSVLLVILAK
jgi:hypothetical protein